MVTAQTFFAVTVVEKLYRDGVIIFTLARPDGAPLPAFTAGAHISLRLPDGLIRQYSLCGDAGRPDRYRLAILVAPDAKGAGVYLRDSVAVGTSVQICAPRNDFPLANLPRPSLLLAGGIGITPLLSMAQTLRAQGRQFQLSCGLGICGTCLAEVKDGIPDHRDDYLSVEQKQTNHHILLCCSRALTPRLVIDL